MKNSGRNGLIVGFLTASIAYYYALNTYNEKRDRTAISESFVPVVQYIWGTFAEIIIVSLVYLPSLMFDLYKCNSSTRINPILMTVPAAMSLLQDITFYFALSMVLDSQMAFLSIRGLALPILVFLTRFIIRKVYTTGMLLSLVLLLGGAGLALVHGEAAISTSLDMSPIFMLLVIVSATSSAMLHTIES